MRSPRRAQRSAGGQIYRTLTIAFRAHIRLQEGGAAAKSRKAFRQIRRGPVLIVVARCGQDSRSSERVLTRRALLIPSPPQGIASPVPGIEPSEQVGAVLGRASMIPNQRIAEEKMPGVIEVFMTKSVLDTDDA